MTIEWQKIYYEKEGLHVINHKETKRLLYKWKENEEPLLNPTLEILPSLKEVIKHKKENNETSTLQTIVELKTLIKKNTD